MDRKCLQYPHYHVIILHIWGFGQWIKHVFVQLSENDHKMHITVYYIEYVHVHLQVDVFVGCNRHYT